jgi:uncharacterized protein YfdQ (DUF2303 family)
MKGTNMNEEMTSSIVKELVDTGKVIATEAREIIELNGQSFLMLPNSVNGDGDDILNLTRLLPEHAQDAPRRKTGVVHMQSLDSFAGYVNAHKEDGAAIYVTVNADGASFVGVLNGHGEKPGHSDHLARYTLKPSVEWDKWMRQNNNRLSQEQFVNHIEDCQDFITVPVAADLLKLLSNLQGHVHADFKQVINLYNGSSKLVYDEDVVIRGETARGAGELVMPTEIKLVLAAFENVKPFQVSARLRMRSDNKRLVFTYDTMNTHLVVKQTVNTLLEDCEQLTGIKPYLGVFAH